jgi:TP901 family phage tail tape measure protein
MARNNVVNFLLNVQANASGVAGVLNGVTKQLTSVQKAASTALTGPGRQSATPQTSSPTNNSVSRELGPIQPYTQRAAEVLNTVVPQMIADADKVASYISKRLPAGISEAATKMKAVEITYASESVQRAVDAAEKKVAAEKEALDKVARLTEKKAVLQGKYNRARVNKPKYAAELTVTEGELKKATGDYEKAAKERLNATKKVEAEISKVVKNAASANSAARREETKDAIAEAKKLNAEKKNSEGKASQMGAQYKQVANAIKTSFSAAGSAIKSMAGVVEASANSVRYITQGISEAGRALLYSVAIPAGAALTKSTMFAVEFESAMTRVRKTTGLTKREIAELGAFAQEFSQYTPTNQVGIAEYMEQIGQLGVYSVNGLKRLAVVSEKLSASTDIDSKEVALSIGRIANAFGYNLNTEQGVKNVERLASVVNLLENTTASSAGEIITAMEDVAAVGNMLKIPEQKLAAIVATMISSGTEASTAGTQLTRWYTTIIRKTEEFAKIMDGYTNEVGESYEDMESVLNKINVDPVGALTDAIDALYRTGDDERAQKLANFFEVSGQVGGKVAVLAGSYNNLKDAIKAASAEWENGTSLNEEYNIAVMTTDSHLKALKNNLSMLANTVGSVLLPVITKGTEYAIPLIQMLAKSFSSLDRKTQLLIIGVPLLVAVLTPVLLLFGQLGHAASLMMMGVLTSFGAVGKVVTSVSRLLFSALPALISSLTTAGGAAAGLTGIGSSLLGLVGPIAAVIAVIGGAIFAIKSLQAAGVDISKFFLDLATKAQKWGENFSKMIGNGILGGGVRFVATAASKVAKMIARFFESHSPPETGPLSTIDQWGRSLMATYLEGFALADFSILSDVAGTIRRMLDISHVLGEIGEEAIVPALRQAKTDIANLIVTFNKTGEVAADVLGKIASNFGALGKDVQHLIELWLDYEKIQRRIAELEKAKKKTLWIYDDEIAKISQMNISAEQKAELMRQAMYNRDQELRTIEKQLKIEEENAAAAKEKLDWQKAFIDAQLDDLELLKDIKKATQDVADIMSGLSFPMPDPQEGGEAVEEITGYFNDLQEAIDGARGKLAYFFMGFRGEEFSPQDRKLIRDDDPEAYKEISNLYDMGKDAAKAWENFSGILDGFNNGPLAGLISGSSGLKDSPLFKLFGGGKEEGSKEQGGGPLSEDSQFMRSLANARVQIELFKVSFGGLLVTLGPLASVLFGLLGAVIGTAINFIVGAFSVFMDVQLLLQGTVVNFIAILGGLGQIIKGIFTGNVGEIIDGISKTITSFLTLLLGFARQTLLILVRGGGVLVDAALGILGGLITAVVSLFLGDEAGKAVGEWFAKARTEVERIFGGIVTWVEERAGYLLGVINGVKEAFAGIKDRVPGGTQQTSNSGTVKLPGTAGMSINLARERGMATGGIAMGPTHALIAEGGEPEVVSPLSKLPQLFSELYGDMHFKEEPAQTIQININNPSVRNDQDIEKIARQVERALSRRASNSMRMGTT